MEWIEEEGGDATEITPIKLGKRSLGPSRFQRWASTLVITLKLLSKGLSNLAF